MAIPSPKRNYKDSLFCHLFGSDERKENALELYNALAGTSYSDPGSLELTTIEGAVFLGLKNDVSFLVGDEMVMLEHQSTHCPNMPLRGLQYFSRLYGKLVAERAKQAGVNNVVFDRGGYVYTGRVAALAAGAREAGLEF